MTEIRNFKSVLVIKYWNLRFVCDLVLEIWDYGFGIEGLRDIRCGSGIPFTAYCLPLTTDYWILTPDSYIPNLLLFMRLSFFR